MKKMITFIISNFIILNAFSMTGDEVADKIYQSNRDQTSITKTKMVLIDKMNNKKERVFYTFSIDNNKYDSQTITYFETPKKIKDTSLYIQNSNDSDTNQWLFLPALKKTRRISSAKKSGRFVNSDLSYEDLEDRETTLDNHKIIKKDKIGNKEYIILETVPKVASTSIYTKVISWVDTTNWTIVKADFYKQHKTPYKSIKSRNFKKFGNSWRAQSTEIINYDIKTKTQLTLLSVDLKTKLENSFFNKSTLENPNKLTRYLK